MFVHDPPDGSASVQSPGPSAFGSGFEALQLTVKSVRVSGLVKWRRDDGRGY